MPANIAALLKKAEPGAELTCRAHDGKFTEAGIVTPRGVISYYAALTLPGAGDLGSWLQRIEETSQANITNGVITPFYRPDLQVVGDGNRLLPGKPEQ